MDKQQTTKIKIKINGDERPFKEEVSIHNWNSGNNEAAAATEQVQEEEQFDWVLPEIEENTVNEFKKIYYEPAVETSKSGKKFKTNSTSHLLTIIISAVTAISIGVLFGYIMLKVIAYQSEGVSQKTLGDENSIPTNAGIAKSEFVTLPSISTSVIQGGVYDNAASPANDIKAKGLPATIITLGGKQYIFLSVSDNLQTAKQLAEEIKKQNVDIYAKQLTFKGKDVKITTKDEQTFLQQTASFFQLMANEVSNAYLSGELEQDGLTKIKSQYNKFQQIKDIKNDNVKNLFSLQSECYQHLLEFQKNNDQKEIISAEQSLLAFLKQYNDM